MLKRQRQRTEEQQPAMSVDRHWIARSQRVFPRRDLLLDQIDAQRRTADDRAASHAARNHRRVRGHSASSRHQSRRRFDAHDVIRRSLGANQDRRHAALTMRRRFLRRKHNRTRRCAWGRWQSSDNRRSLRIFIDGGKQQLRKTLGLTATQRFNLRDLAFAHQIARHPHHRSRRALARPRLKQIEPS